MTFNNIPSCGMSFQLLTGETDGFYGSHAPAWEPIPVLSSAAVCIPTQERGNEAALSNGRPLDAASPWLIRETGGFLLSGGGKPSNARFFP